MAIPQKRSNFSINIFNDNVKYFAEFLWEACSNYSLDISIVNAK